MTPPVEVVEGTIRRSPGAGSSTEVVDAATARVPQAATRSRRRVLPRTTPAWLRVMAIGIGCLSVLLAVTGVRLGIGRANATRDVAVDATPLLVDSQDLYVALADADAAASTAFLQAGKESPDLRTRYADDVARADAKLAAIARHGGLDQGARDNLDHITQQLSVYSGQVATARANNRLDFPVGAAYLRLASKLMREEMLPAALAIYRDAAAQLHDGYVAGTSSAEVAVWATVAAAVAIALIAAQVFVARRTRRVFNLGLLAATLLVVGLAGWTAHGLLVERDALVDAQRQGSDHFLVLSSARIETLRAMADENLDLIQRGTEPAYITDFTAAQSAVDGPAGLLAKAAQISESTGIGLDQVSALRDQFAGFVVLHSDVRDKVNNGLYQQAVDQAIGDEASAAAKLDTSYQSFTAQAHDRLTNAVSDARDALQVLPAAMGLIALGAGLLAVIGLDRRIREYR
jgi:hypothetical protein